MTLGENLLLLLATDLFVVVDNGKVKRRSTKLIGVVGVEVTASHQRPQLPYVSALGRLQQLFFPRSRLHPHDSR